MNSSRQIERSTLPAEPVFILKICYQIMSYCSCSSSLTGCKDDDKTRLEKRMNAMVQLLKAGRTNRLAITLGQNCLLVRRLTISALCREGEMHSLRKYKCCHSFICLACLSVTAMLIRLRSRSSSMFVNSFSQISNISSIWSSQLFFISSSFNFAISIILLYEISIIIYPTSAENVLTSCLV